MFRKTLLIAILKTLLPRDVLLLFFFEVFTPEKRKVSTGDTKLAILDGFMLLINAVMNENSPAPVKINGEYDGDMAPSMIMSPDKARIPKGTIKNTVAALNIKPESIPQKLNTRTWR